jgi:elongation factor G
MKAIKWHGEDLGATFEEVDIPEELSEEAEKYHSLLVEAIAECDDALTEKYLEGQVLSEDEIKFGARKGCLSNQIIPVLCGASFKNKGVQPLLDAIIDLLPSPLEVKPVEGIDPKRPDAQAQIRKASVDEPLSALAFKIQIDPFVGTLTYVRIYSGQLEVGKNAFNIVKGKRERIGKVMRMHANKREEVQKARAGDIICLVGLRFTTTGDTFCDEKHPILLENIIAPEPVISVVIEPKTKADQDKLQKSLELMAIEDPSFHLRMDEETAQTLISGMGELHLDIIVDRLKRQFKVNANVGQPQVAYKETITREASGSGKFERQLAGKEQFGQCRIKLEPRDQGLGFEFVNKIDEKTVPREFAHAIETGIRDSLFGGIVAGYQVIDVRATLLQSEYREETSTALAYKIAAASAFKEAAQGGSPIILEPIMSLEVTSPEKYMGGVVGDLNGRRGKIMSMSERHGLQVVKAEAPLATMFGYSTALRSSSQGRATFTMEFSQYEAVPPNIAEDIKIKMGILPSRG